VRSRYKRIVYKRIWVASLPFQSVWATFSSYWAESAVSYNENALYSAFSLLCFSQTLDLGASASVAKSLFHWLRGRFMMLKRMLRIQFL